MSFKPADKAMPYAKMADKKLPKGRPMKKPMHKKGKRGA